MNKRKIHFAYTVPLSKSILRRALDKFVLAFGITPIYRYGFDFLIPWQRPVRSPHCISYHLLHKFRSKYAVRFYNIYEHILPKIAPQVIFIGQPLAKGGFGEVRPDTDDRESVSSKVIRSRNSSSNYLIMPYTHDPLYVSWVKDLLEDHKGGVIFVGGKIWERDWHKSPFKDVDIKRKIHVEMGIDPNDYPVVKKTFNPKGKRKYLYIGHTAWYKNTKELENIAINMPQYEFAHIGGGDIKGFKKLSDFASLTPEFMAKIASEYDIFINTSTGDAQATTILEQMCFGMVVACTPETGYDHDSLVFLSTNDTSRNVKILSDLQEMDESDLLLIAKRNRENAIKFHSWDIFTQKIMKFIEE